MDNQKSITRSKQLHEIGQALSHRSEQVPCGLHHAEIGMQQQRKQGQVLRLLFFSLFAPYRGTRHSLRWYYPDQVEGMISGLSHP